ncbi:MAG: helix-turn-helix transcriptional regulator [Kofleriaceae bacterium]|nr:helix-turn-helix transcriptional regulator [Kofleriaceae bacterium]
MSLHASARQVVEVAYRAAASTDWLAEVTRAAAGILSRGRGMIAFEYTMGRTDVPAVHPPITRDLSVARANEMVSGALATMPVSMIGRLFARPSRTVQSSTEVLCPGRPLASVSKLLGQQLATIGAGDCIAINLRAPSGRGIVLGGLCAEVTTLSRDERRASSLAARHLEGALRLRDVRAVETADAAAFALVRAPGIVGDVARALASGAAQKYLAIELGLPPGSVYRYIELLKAETGLASTVHLVAALREALPEALPQAHRPTLAVLSASEREVIEGALRGLTSREIAELRGSSSRTVENLLASAYRRLGVASRKELAARFGG